jgi:hypothetical protein
LQFQNLPDCWRPQGFYGASRPMPPDHSLSLLNVNGFSFSSCTHKKAPFLSWEMEPFVSGGNQIIQNNAIGLPSDAPLSNVLHLFCQEFKYISAVIRSRQISTVPKFLTSVPTRYIKSILEKSPAFTVNVASIFACREPSLLVNDCTMNVLKEAYGRHAVEKTRLINPGGKPGT